LDLFFCRDERSSVFEISDVGWWNGFTFFCRYSHSDQSFK